MFVSQRIISSEQNLKFDLYLKRFKEYWLKYKDLHDSIPQDIKTQIIMGLKNRMYAEGMVLETLTFNEWIKQVEEIE